MNEKPDETQLPLTPLPPGATSEEALEAVLVDDRPVTRRPRRKWLPITLFLLTCFTTFAAGCYGWSPAFLGLPRAFELKAGESITVNGLDGEPVTINGPGFVGIDAVDLFRLYWKQGLIFMACVMSILLFHEMGHFLMTLKYKVPASFPFFIPVPIMFLGTMGAVIVMDPRKANRKEIFDIGIAGPLAGLVLTIPFVLYGLSQAKSDVVPTEPQPGSIEYGDPLLVKMLAPLF
ncbi:MAG: site-2 protease family protein, partial [Planctomycetales bacterium]